MPRRVVGLPGSGAWGALARSVLSDIPGEHGSLPLAALAPVGQLVLVLRDQGELEDVSDAYSALGPLFPGAPGAAAVLGEDARARLAALETLREGARLALATPASLAEPAPAPGAFADKTIRLRSGTRIKRDDLLERLALAGYQRVDFVESPGEFAARGAVVDFYGLEPLRAVRVLFDEDTVASLRSFEPGTQATLEQLSQAKAVPAAAELDGAAFPREAGSRPDALEGSDVGVGTVADWLSKDALWLVQEGAQLPPGLAPARLFEGARALELSGDDLDFGARGLPSFKGRPEAAWDEMRRLGERGLKVVLYSLNRGEDRRMQELLEDRLPHGLAQFLIGPLQHGFSHDELKLAVFSTSEIFDRHYRAAARWRYFSAATRGGLRWRELRVGDYVVHQDYGVARYKGLSPVPSPGHGTVDCLKLEFRGSDTLYIPMSEFGRVQKYSGAEGKRPRLSSLDTRKWEEIKRHVKEGVRELAEQLLRLQAQRAARPGHAFPEETPMEREFAEAFPYEETPDQAAAIRDTLDDMMAPAPMDRVVIGDVGFGKTEVAMRAAFKAVAGFKQVAVLVPTTILADQHYRTFSSRMADYPVRLGILTRFQTKAEQKRVVEALAQGKLDVVIGTSRLLQKDIKFKDLGLAIIDEEHRFGVKDKERLKQLRANIDVLALSATPIPRTLNQALSGLRGISLIQSAPTGRQPIVTKVGPWNEDVVAEAVREEMGRGGQCYYVHNRVRSMTEVVERLRKLAPQARFGMVHGQMKGAQIEDAMWKFFNKEFDVLVASTIIESGLDNPSVNTLLVEDAQDFGLAQLYQLRGRIGRERQRAYCYLFYPEGHEDFSMLSEDARKRLEALREFGALGAGIKLAMRDLEIRGAGELLGARQHGFIAAVGVDFYTQLLTEEISQRKGKPAEREKDVSIDIKLPAFIPETYLPGELERLDFYKRILRARPEDVPALRRELEDLSGPSPEPVDNLFSLLRARALAREAGVRCATQKGDVIEVVFRSDHPVAPQAIAAWTKAYKSRLRFIRSEDGDGISVDLQGEPALAWLEAFLAALPKRP